MPYQFLEDEAIADVAFNAWGKTKEEMFIASAEAMMNVMVKDLKTIHPKQEQSFSVQDLALDMLLFQFLQELIFFKDAKKLLLRVNKIEIIDDKDTFILNAQSFGEVLNPKKHELIVDVKAVTLHHFRIDESLDGWKAHVILDI